MTREHAQRELESFTALADGRTIQERLRYVKDAKWTTCSATAPARFDETTEHRVATEPVPPGDLTWEEAKRLHENGVEIEFIMDAKPIDTYWQTVIYWFEGATEEAQRRAAYRRKPAPPADAPCAECGHPVSSHTRRGCLVRSSETRCYCDCLRPPEKCGEPAPRMVELEWSDVKPTDLFRLRGGGPGWQLPVGVSPNGVWFASNESFPLKFWPFSQMKLEVERSQDSGATWTRCEKPAKEEAP